MSLSNIIQKISHIFKLSNSKFPQSLYKPTIIKGVNMTTKLPIEYADLNNAIIHPLIREALKLYGVKEYEGEANNPEIIGWAKEVNLTIKEWYRKDSDAWCALFMSVVCKRAGFTPPDGFNAIRANSFAKWGDPIFGFPLLGDVLVFTRSGGGHVGIYVGEDSVCYYVLGGNQGNAVCITRIPKERLLTTRRAPINPLPKVCKRIFRTGKGQISLNEA